MFQRKQVSNFGNLSKCKLFEQFLIFLIFFFKHMFSKSINTISSNMNRSDHNLFLCRDKPAILLMLINHAIPFW